MNIDYNEKDKLLTFEVTEEIDHHWSEKIRRQVDDEIERLIPKKVIFDFDKVTFMDSAGIGMLIGRYKAVKMLGGNLELINVKNNIRKILEMSGIPKKIGWFSKMRKENKENVWQWNVTWNIKQIK